VENSAAVQSPSSVSAPTGSANTTSSNPLADQYREQLAQMRDMGISDEQLSILALRVSDGDVATAVELIFSGWTGEGADAEI
jgi:type IV pilus biogenesis protein CpaD/CtpE